MSHPTLYDHDFYAWSQEQAGLLRAGKLSEADIQHIAEEIESLGRSEKRELVSRLSILLMHLLKWQYQAPRRGRSWRTAWRFSESVWPLICGITRASSPSLEKRLRKLIA